MKERRFPCSFAYLLVIISCVFMYMTYMGAGGQDRPRAMYRFGEASALWSNSADKAVMGKHYLFLYCTELIGVIGIAIAVFSALLDIGAGRLANARTLMRMSPLFALFGIIWFFSELNIDWNYSGTPSSPPDPFDSASGDLILAAIFTLVVGLFFYLASRRAEQSE